MSDPPVSPLDSVGNKISKIRVLLVKVSNLTNISCSKLAATHFQNSNAACIKFALCEICRSPYVTFDVHETKFTRTSSLTRTRECVLNSSPSLGECRRLVLAGRPEEKHSEEETADR